MLNVLMPTVSAAFNQELQAATRANQVMSLIKNKRNALLATKQALHAASAASQVHFISNQPALSAAKASDFKMVSALLARATIAPSATHQTNASNAKKDFIWKVGSARNA